MVRCFVHDLRVDHFRIQAQNSYDCFGGMCMKKWMSLSVVFLLIVLCSYYGMGVGTEKILKRNIDVLNQSSEIKVAIQHYQRGWFRSHAELKWTIQIPESSADQSLHRTVFPLKKAYTFEVPLDIYHGPMMWVNYRLYFGLGYAHAKAHLPTAIEQELAKNYNYNAEKFEYTINVIVNYLNKTTVQFSIPQYRMNAKKGDNFFQWLGMMTNIAVSGDKQHLQGDLFLKGFSWKNKDVKGLLGSVKGSYDMQQALDNLYIGTAELSAPSLAIFHKDLPIFRLNDVQLHSESDLQDGLFNSSFSAKVNQVTVGDKVGSRYVFDLSFQNLDANVLAVMNRKLRELQTTTHDTQRLLWALLPDLPALLSKGARVSLDNFEMNMNMPSGRVKMDLNLSLPNEKFTNPLQILQKIKGESHLTVSKAVLSTWLQEILKKAMLMQAQKQSLAKEMHEPDAVVAPTSAPDQKQASLPSMTSVENPNIADSQLSMKADAKIKEWTHEGVLVQEGTDYSVLLTLIDGKLFINGHPFNPTLLAV